MLLPKFHTGMNNPLDNYINNCPHEEISDSKPRKSLKKMGITTNGLRTKSLENNLVMISLISKNLPSNSMQYHQARIQR